MLQIIIKLVYCCTKVSNSKNDLKKYALEKKVTAKSYIQHFKKFIPAVTFFCYKLKN